MGLVNTGTTVEMMVYLTNAGREALLRQGFAPKYFSLVDEDVNYNANEYLTQSVPDITGDYNDNIYSISKNILLKNQILVSPPTTTNVATTSSTVNSSVVSASTALIG